jgi:hypothetical protein
MTHGVSVWLCKAHSGEAYLRRERGERFASRLATAWAGCGALTRRRLAALEAHVMQRSAGNDARARPGSHSRPRLRIEAERRFAAGEDPRRVIAELRGRHAGGAARPPSVRTMRRWFTEARWRAPTLSPSRRTRRERPRTRVVPDCMLLPPVMHPYLPQMPVSPFRRGP